MKQYFFLTAAERYIENSGNKPSLNPEDCMLRNFLSEITKTKLSDELKNQRIFNEVAQGRRRLARSREKFVLKGEENVCKELGNFDKETKTIEKQYLQELFSGEISYENLNNDIRKLASLSYQDLEKKYFVAELGNNNMDRFILSCLLWTKSTDPLFRNENKERKKLAQASLQAQTEILWDTEWEEIGKGTFILEVFTRFIKKLEQKIIHSSISTNK